MPIKEIDYHLTLFATPAVECFGEKTKRIVASKNCMQVLQKAVRRGDCSKAG